MAQPAPASPEKQQTWEQLLSRTTERIHGSFLETAGIAFVFLESNRK